MLVKGLWKTEVKTNAMCKKISGNTPMKVNGNKMGRCWESHQITMHFGSQVKERSKKGSLGGSTWNCNAVLRKIQQGCWRVLEPKSTVRGNQLSPISQEWSYLSIPATLSSALTQQYISEPSAENLNRFHSLSLRSEGHISMSTKAMVSCFLTMSLTVLSVLCNVTGYSQKLFNINSD